MTLNDFIAKYTGQPNVGDTPENTGQCVGLVEIWTDSLGLPHTWGNAADLPTNADRNSFDVTYNSPDAVPSPGDIFCFDGYYGAGVGHTGIVVSATPDNVTLFQQNDPEGSTPHLKAYSYDHSIGWLHPKVLIQQEDEDLITKDDTDRVRIINSEVQGPPAYPFNATQTGKFDAQEMVAWTGQPWTKFIDQKWKQGEAFRNKRTTALDYYDNQRPQVEAELVKAQATISDLLAAAAAAQVKPVVDPLSRPSQPSETSISTTNDTTGASWSAGFVAWLKSILGIK